MARFPRDVAARLKSRYKGRVKLKLPRRPRTGISRRSLVRAIPNSMTLFNVAVGLAAILLAWSGEYEKSAGLIIVSVIIDSFDGYVARLFDSTSKFGSYLDTISDFLAFGLAASLLMVNVFRVNLLVAGFFIFASGFRLLYFLKTKNSKFFFGLPTTVVGGFLATAVFIRPDLPLAPDHLMLILSLLMVSRVKYYRIDVRGRKTLSMILAIFLTLFVLDVTLAIRVVMIFFLSYILLGWLRIKEVK